MLRIFTPIKIQRLQPGLYPQTWVPEASMLTTRPPKPSHKNVGSDGFFFSPVALGPNAGHGLLMHEFFLDNTQRRTTVGRTPLD